MPQTPHTEHHFTGSETIRDIVIGMSDGLTVPFALAAGLSGALASSSIVVTAGVAEMAAGSIAMGLGGYLAAKADGEHYASELVREQREIIEKTDIEIHETKEIFTRYGVAEEHIVPLVDALRARPDSWVDFMMQFELGLQKPDPKRAIISAFTIGGSYIAGGIVPLLAYFFIPDARLALPWSAAMTLLALVVFGAVKGRLTSGKMLRSAVRTTIVGTLAALTAYGLATLLS
jgi:vacuolar iron transporter family protein